MEKNRTVVWITGKTGSGKSYLLKDMLNKLSRWILLDSMKEYSSLPAFHVYSFRELIDYLAVAPKDFRIVLNLDNPLSPLTLSGGKKVTSCEFLCQIVYETLTNATIVIEELGKFETRKDLAPWLYNIICLGRHKSLSVYATSQRPAQVHPDFKAQVNKLISFKQHLQNDLDGLTYCIGDKKEAETLRALADFKYKEYNL